MSEKTKNRDSTQTKLERQRTKKYLKRIGASPVLFLGREMEGNIDISKSGGERQKNGKETPGTFFSSGSNSGVKENDPSPSVPTCGPLCAIFSDQAAPSPYQEAKRRVDGFVSDLEAEDEGVVKA